LVVSQDAIGGRTITLPSTSNKVIGSTSTTTIALSSAANAKDILNFYYDGTNCYWNIGQGYGTAATLASTNLATSVSGTLEVANGGTGLSTTPANGQIDIGNGTGFTRATLTAGTGITITNGAGSIAINATPRSWTDQPATVSANQTTFTLTYAPPASVKVWMFINGVRTNNNAYSVSGTTLTYTPASNGGYAIASSDRIQFDYTY
jgi:hypothetical protein